MALTSITMTGASKENIKEGFTKVNDIIDDLAATTSGLGASCIGIYDSAGNYAAANVETALAEVYTDHAAALSMSSLFDVNSATTTGLTWGHKGGALRNDNTITTVAAGTVSLNDDATNYVEVGTDGTVYVVLSAFTSGRIPIRTVVTASGVQGTSTDKRAWFSTWATGPSDTAYAASWDGVTTIGPSKNAVYDKLETMGGPVLITETTAAHTAAATELYKGTTYTSSYAGETIITLPAGASGYGFTGVVTVAQYLQFLANGTETFRFLATQSAAGGYIRSNVVGNTVEIEWSGSEWVITGLGGAWTYDE
uniref:Uncharacterized protein n=1 Tax=viral metagenome TaxID=1070528 RepID=A0A6H1Z6W1_9ZZZZ